MKSLSRRLKRLQNRLCDMQVIPFLGAGVSASAQNPHDNNFKPTIDFMKGKLANSLRQYFLKHKDAASSDDALYLLRLSGLIGIELLDCISDLYEQINENGKDGSDRHVEIKELFRDAIIDNSELQKDKSFDRIAEVCNWLWGCDKTCQILEIEKFADLEPLPAHRYLAYLAREGLFTEIITTNYDCCIEKAFLNSFGPDMADEGAKALVTITNLAQYRKSGGKSFTSSGPRRPILHIFKINGCAREYKKHHKSSGNESSPNSTISARIILTEKQLQSFRNEQWAKELFKDRARSHCLVFSGFGSEEPQIRHTAMNLVQEFQNDPEVNTFSDPEEVAKLPNAPFVAAYQYPTFTQMQVLDGYMQAHLTCSYNKGRNRQMAAAMNVFSGSDVPALQKLFRPEEKKDNKLTADLFWQAVFVLGFACLLRQQAGHGSPFLKWLEIHAVPANRWQGFLMEKLFPILPKNKNSGLDGLFGEIRHLLKIEKNNPQRPLILYQWLAVMEKPYMAHLNTDWYLPLREDPLMILITLLFLIILTGENKIPELCDHVQPVNGLGLEIKINGNADGSDYLKTIYLISEASSGKIKLNTTSSSKSRLIIRVAIPSLRYLDTEKRWELRYGERNKIHRLKIGRIITVAARNLIQKAYLPENKKLIDALIEEISAYRPKRSQRLKLIRSTSLSGYNNNEE